MMTGTDIAKYIFVLEYPLEGTHAEISSSQQYQPGSL